MQVRREAVMWAVLGVGSGLTMALAAYLLIAPVTVPPIPIPWRDKILHAIAFAGLTAPGVLVLPRKYLWFWLAHLLALGVGIEIVQARFEQLGRSGSAADVVADAVGILVAWGACRWIRRRFEADPAAPGAIART